LRARRNLVFVFEVAALTGTLAAMSAQTDFNVKYVARLARLALTPEEEVKFQSQLDNILGYIAKLNELDVSNVEPTAHAVPLVNVVRPDQARPSMAHEEAMKNAPAQLNGLFLVPKIVE
jgi:aspartyl-tRNA(Asn)/glutamyl-tRNA(Gln) amidotransferase subunit C